MHTKHQTPALALLRRALGAAEPPRDWTWDGFVQRLPRTSRVTVDGVRYLIETNRNLGVLFAHVAGDPEAELLSFRIMNGNLTLLSHGNYRHGLNVYEVLRKHRTPTALLQYLLGWIQRYAGGTTTAAAEPAAPGNISGPFSSVYTKFMTDAWDAYRKTVLTDHNYGVSDVGGSQVFTIGIQYTAKPSVPGKSLILTPHSYDAARGAEHVSVGYFSVRDLLTPRIRVLNIREGEAKDVFDVPAPVLDHAELRRMLAANDTEDKRAFIHDRVDAVVDAIGKIITKATAAAGRRVVFEHPLHLYKDRR